MPTFNLKMPKRGGDTLQVAAGGSTRKRTKAPAASSPNNALEAAIRADDVRAAVRALSDAADPSALAANVGDASMGKGPGVALAAALGRTDMCMLLTLTPGSRGAGIDAAN